MQTPSRSTRHNVFIAAALVSTTGILFRFSPAEYHFYPVCPIHQFTGILCPGCGATRALAALLHGQLHDAIQFNALFVFVLLPLAFVYLGAAVRQGRWLRIPTKAAIAFAVVSAGFTVARNLH